MSVFDKYACVVNSRVLPGSDEDLTSSCRNCGHLLARHMSDASCLFEPSKFIASRRFPRHEVAYIHFYSLPSVPCFVEYKTVGIPFRGTAPIDQALVRVPFFDEYLFYTHPGLFITEYIRDSSRIVKDTQRLVVLSGFGTVDAVITARPVRSLESTELYCVIFNSTSQREHTITERLRWLGILRGAGAPVLVDFAEFPRYDRPIYGIPCTLHPKIP